MEKYNVKLKNEVEEKEYKKERSCRILDWLIVENRIYLVIYIPAILSEIYFMLMEEGSEIVGSMKMVVGCQFIFWVFLYILTKIANKLFSNTKVGYWRNGFCISLSLVVHIIYLLIIPSLAHSNKTRLITFYIIHSSIVHRNLLPNWILQILLSYPFYLFQLYSIYAQSEKFTQDILILELLLGYMFWGIIRAYKDDMSSRKRFPLNPQILKENNESNGFLQAAPIVLIHYDIRTKEFVLNPKAQQVIHNLNTMNFLQFAQQMKLKENPNLNLIHFIENKAADLQGMSNQKETQYTQNSHDSYDFQFLMELDASRVGKRSKIIDFEIYLYWKDLGRVSVLIEGIGRREKLREEKVARECKDIMFRAMSHDLKTPLNGLSSLLDEQCKRSPTLENRVMLMNTRFLESKIDDIQDFTTIETGNFEKKNELFNLDQFLSEIKGLCELQAVLDQVRISVRKIGNLPEKIYADRTRLKQILIHLFQNGIKYSFKRGIVIFYVRNIVKEEVIEFGVKNSGTEIPIEHQFTIFDFLNPHQAEVEDSLEDLTTTSFGLPITQQIAKSIGSSLKLKSSSKNGTIFYFRMSIKDKEEEVPDRHIADRKAEDNVVEYLDFRGRKNRRERGRGYDRRMKEEDDPSYSLNSLNQPPNPPVGLLDSEINREVIERGEKKKYIYPILHGVCRQDISESKEEEILSENEHMQTERSTNSHYSNLFKYSAGGNATKKLHYGKPIISSSCSPPPKSNNDKRESILLRRSSNEEIHFLQPPATQFAFSSEQQKTFNKDKGNRVLTVEDNGVNRLVLRKLLEKRGFQVEEAFNGQEAVTIVQEKIRNKEKESFSFVFMDLNMPVMNGLQSTKILLALMKQGKINKVPIFALTAHDTKQLERKCDQIGFTHFLTKPIKLDDLDRVLRTYNLLPFK